MGSKFQDRLEVDHSRAFSLLWRIQFLTRIKLFGWGIFLNKLVTKDQLKKRSLCLSSNRCVSVIFVEIKIFINLTHKARVSAALLSFPKERGKSTNKTRRSF